MHACHQPDVSSGQCFIHAPGKAIQKLHFDSGETIRVDATTREAIAICALCQQRRPQATHHDIIHVTHRRRWQDQLRRSAYAQHTNNIHGLTAYEIAKPTPEALAAELRDQSPRLVIVHGFCFPANALIRCAELHPHITFVSVDHSSLNHTFTWPQYFADYRAALAASEQLPNLYAASVDRYASWQDLGYPRFFRWHNPVYVPANRTPAPIEPPTVIITGRVDWMKGLPAQITAAALLQRRRDVQCLIAWIHSTDRQAGLREHAAACGLRYQSLPYADYDAWYTRLREQVSIVLQPSMSDSFNIVSAEALLHGRPFIGSPVIAHTPEDWSVRDPNNPGEIADVAERILDNYEKESRRATMLGETLADRQNAAYTRMLQTLLEQ